MMRGPSENPVQHSPDELGDRQCDGKPYRPAVKITIVLTINLSFVFIVASSSLTSVSFSEPGSCAA